MKKRTTIICDFPGTGKTFLVRNCTSIGLSVIDTDIGMFGWKINENTGKKEFDPNFPENYVKYIKEVIESGQTDILFVDPHKDVREAMNAAGIKYIFVYPDRSLKLEYLDEFYSRTYDQSFIDFMDHNWDKLIDAVEAYNGPKLKLVYHEYMYPKIMEYLHISDLTEIRNLHK